MKNLLFTLLTVFFVLSVNAQQIGLDKWEKYTSPSIDNYFYHHFKKYVTPDLLSTEIFEKNSSKIILKFYLNDKNEIANASSNSRSKKLNKAILKGFEKLTLSRLKIYGGNKFNKTNYNKYTLQIIANKNGIATLNCSSSVLIEKLPKVVNCWGKNYIEYFENIKKELTRTIASNIEITNKTIINKFNNDGVSTIQLAINSKGEISLKSIEQKDELLKESIQKAIENSYLDIIKSAEINGIPEKFLCTVQLANNNFYLKLTKRKDGSFGKSVFLNSSKNTLKTSKVLNKGDSQIASPLYIGLTLAEQTFELDKWDTYTNPGTDNFINHHFSKYITPKILSKENFNKNSNKIVIQFGLNKENSIVNLRTNSKITSVMHPIIEAFKTIDFSKLKINKVTPTHNYSLQILEKIGDKAVLKCSSNLLQETPPISSEINKQIDFQDYNYNLSKRLKKYLINNINSSDVANLAINSELFDINITIDSIGKFQKVTTTSSNNSLNNVIKKVFENSTINFIPATYNGKNDSYVIAIKPIVDLELIQSEFFKTSLKNKFSTYFQSKIPNSILKLEKLSTNRNSVFIKFTINKKGKLQTIQCTAKNKTVNKKIIEAFKKYPIEKLNLLNIGSPQSIYYLNIIEYNNGKNRISCTHKVRSETPPIISDCSTSKTYDILKKCNKNSISFHINNNIKKYIIKKQLDVKGLRIFTGFKIDNKGLITRIDIRNCPDKIIRDEIVRILKSINVLAPGLSNQTPKVNYYNVPITLQ
ncbi:hypothetical protein R3X25_11230 [Lutibacter sp. TH_r2]|uniref:hypothetical protein n=1 Tax=Lutibacter sp. TH_r2 TaxID=3082083 RepID=UPI002954E92E|nr:hypothetical protein [Lutibacter sp. TH_r2]MDV7187854.1 hypothetical protein [Lutibacter sp. TH_r2]